MFPKLLPAVIAAAFVRWLYVISAIVSYFAPTDCAVWLSGRLGGIAANALLPPLSMCFRLVGIALPAGIGSLAGSL
jgi:hypothetical protein